MGLKRPTINSGTSILPELLTSTLRDYCSFMSSLNGSSHQLTKEKGMKIEDRKDEKQIKQYLELGHTGRKQDSFAFSSK